MAQRRVAPSGFGGSPGLSILQGVAEGRIQREQMDQENRRRAILNRLSRAQMDRMQQSMRLHREEEERLQAKFDREQQMTEAAVGNLKNFAIEDMGMTAEEAEEWAMAKASGFTTQQDIERERANLAQTRSSTASNRVSRQVNEERLHVLRVDQTAKQVLSDPRLLRLLSIPDDELRPEVKQVIIQNQIPALQESGIVDPDIDPELLNEGIDRAMQILQGREDAELGTFFDQRGQARAGARELEMSEGKQGAIEHVRQTMRNNPDNQQVQETGQAMIDYINSRGSGGSMAEIIREARAAVQEARDES